MLVSSVRRPLWAGLLLAAGPALAQVPDTAQRQLPARFQLGETIGLGIALVSPDDDHYLPNDQAKFGSEVQFHATYFFDRRNPVYGLRLGLGLLSRNGRYAFGSEQVRRAEVLGVVPLELVARHYWRNPHWYSEVSAGAYVGDMVQRFTYQLNPLTGTTQRTRDSWVYGVGGVVASFNVGYRRGQRYQQLGVRFSSDFTTPRQTSADKLPNLQAGNISLCYSVCWGKRQ
ncbi:MAG: hypothetical protein EOO56_11095 [Hymenobacter sp.]|nr:MAG: hypothetical protein EOO56_11095 [Hymenobacter sp.]